MDLLVTPILETSMDAFEYSGWRSTSSAKFYFFGAQVREEWKSKIHITDDQCHQMVTSSRSPKVDSLGDLTGTSMARTSRHGLKCLGHSLKQIESKIVTYVGKGY